MRKEIKKIERFEELQAAVKEICCGGYAVCKRKDAVLSVCFKSSCEHRQETVYFENYSYNNESLKI